MVGSYLTIRDKQLLKSFDEVDLMALNGELLCVEPADMNAVLHKDLAATPVVKNNTPEFAYWEGTTEEYGLHITRHGDGQVAYLPWSIGKLYHIQGVPEYSHLIADLIDELNGEREVVTNAPTSAEVIPIHEINLKIRTTGKKVRSLVSKEELNGSRSGEYITVSIPRLDIYDVLVIS